jgi:hypothetical protein
LEQPHAIDRSKAASAGSSGRRSAAKFDSDALTPLPRR